MDAQYQIIDMLGAGEEGTERARGGERIWPATGNDEGIYCMIYSSSKESNVQLWMSQGWREDHTLIICIYNSCHQ
jgi:hypothetical protein